MRGSCPLAASQVARSGLEKLTSRDAVAISLARMFLGEPGQHLYHPSPPYTYRALRFRRSSGYGVCGTQAHTVPWYGAGIVLVDHIGDSLGKEFVQHILRPLLESYTQGGLRKILDGALQ